MNRSFWKKLAVTGVAAVAGITMMFASCGDKKDPVGPTSCTSWGTPVEVPATCQAAGTRTTPCLSSSTYTINETLPQIPASDPRCSTASGCTQWGTETVIQPTCQAPGSRSTPCLSNSAFNHFEVIPQIPASDPRCQTVDPCNPFTQACCATNPSHPNCQSVDPCNPFTQACCATNPSHPNCQSVDPCNPFTQACCTTNPTHPNCQSTPTSWCFWPASAENPEPQCWPIGGALCEGATCSEAACRAEYGMVTHTDCNVSPPTIQYCWWADGCHPITDPLGPSENPGLNNLQNCERYGSVRPSCDGWVAVALKYCVWQVGSCDAFDPNAAHMDDVTGLPSGLTMLEACTNYGLGMSDFSDCRDFTAPTSLFFCDWGGPANCWPASPNSPAVCPDNPSDCAGYTAYSWCEYGAAQNWGARLVTCPGTYNPPSQGACCN